jgi:prepilin-type processing-associated H-X9-DG protein
MCTPTFEEAAMIARQDLFDGPRVLPVDYQNSYTLEPKRRKWVRPLIQLGVVVGLILLLISIMLPAMCGSRESANRIKCANNERQILLAAIMYANDHGGAFPANLHELAASNRGDLGESVYYCPSGSAWPSESEPRLADSIEKISKISYVYVGDHLRPDIDHPETAVILYEAPSAHENNGMQVHIEALADHSGDGMNVGFADGHTEWILPPVAADLFRQAAAQVRPIRVNIDPASRQ